MKVLIENYFGNDVLTLNFYELDVNISDERLKTIGSISNKFGYGVADIDSDEDNLPYIRLQEDNIDNSEKVVKTELINLVTELNKTFL